ncbi:MAG: SH3 domain-containing protein [Anaerolineae bacterium]
MRFIIPVFLTLALIALAGCNQATSDNQDLPTLVAFASETETTTNATATATLTPTEMDVSVSTEAVALETEESTLNSLISNQRYTLTDFEQVELWRIISDVNVNAYQCAQTDCPVRITYRNGALVRVVNTEDGWHTVLTLDGTLAYIEEQFAEFFDTLEIVVANDAPTEPPANTEPVNDNNDPATNTPNSVPVVSGDTPIQVTNSVNDNVINIAPQQATNPPPSNNNNNNNNNGGQPGNPTATFTRTPRPTITPDPFFTPSTDPDDAPPGSVPNPSPSGPSGPISGGGGAPPGSESTPNTNNPPPPPPPPPGF